MSNSERRLLGVFLGLIALLGGWLTMQQFRTWQNGIDRKERNVELSQMEARALLAESEHWKACAEWLAQAQPAAQSDLEAEQGLLDTLRQSSDGAGLETKQTKLEPKQITGHYRQFGVTLTLRGEVTDLFRWLHALLQPSAFYVVPSLSIVPDKEEPTKVTATVQIWRWYLPELAAAPEAEEGAQPVPQ